MPTANVSIPKNATLRFKVKVSQDGTVLTPPGSIAHSSSAPTLCSLTRQPDDAGRAVFHIGGLNEGNAQLEVGSGTGKLVISAVVTAPAPGPLVFELDGTFEAV